MQVLDSRAGDCNEHTQLFIGHEASQTGALYRLPVISSFAWTVAVVPLGIARGAMNAFRELAQRKARQGTAALLRDREIVQANFGRVAVLHQAARACLIEAMAELIAAMPEDGQRMIEARATFNENQNGAPPSRRGCRCA